MSIPGSEMYGAMNGKTLSGSSLYFIVQGYVALREESSELML